MLARWAFILCMEFTILIISPFANFAISDQEYRPHWPRRAKEAPHYDVCLFVCLSICPRVLFRWFSCPLPCSCLRVKIVFDHMFGHVFKCKCHTYVNQSKSSLRISFFLPVIVTTLFFASRLLLKKWRETRNKRWCGLIDLNIWKHFWVV